MLEEGQIQCCTDCVELVGIKHNLSAIVALFNRGKNVLGVIASISIRSYVTRLGPRLAWRKRLERCMRLALLTPRVAFRNWTDRSRLRGKTK